MADTAYPDFHKTMLAEATYPEAKRRIKLVETRHSYVYKTGDTAYVVRKTGPADSGIALKEAYAHETLALGKRWAPDVYLGVVPIVRTAAGFALAGEGAVVAYALKLSQLSDNYWLHKLLGQKKFSPSVVGKLGRYLAQCHRDSSPEAIPPEK